MTDGLDEVEMARLAKLKSFGILDTPHEREFDVIAWLAKSLLGCPIAAVSLVDGDRQWFKARQGLDIDETSRDVAFCAHAMHADDIMVVEDARQDPRFAQNPLVTAEENPLLFYAGVPLRPSSAGFSDDLPGIGTLCVADNKPRTFSPEQIEILQDLAAMVSSLIRARADAGYALELAQIAEDRAIDADRKNRQLRQAERMAGIGSWRYDIASNTVEWSDQVFAIHGLPPGSDTPSFEDAMNFYKPEDRERINGNLGRAVNGESFDFEADFITAEGALRRVRSVGEAEWLDGKPVAVIGVFQDVTDSYGREEVLRRSAYTDSLTGLPNRAAFERQLDESLALARSEDAPLSLLLLDLDGFKAVNDSFGHDAGDDVLRFMADQLRGQNFANAFSARLGGDEFVMLVSRPRDCAKLEKFVSKVLGSLIYTVTRDGQTRAVSATVGAARFHPRILSAGELLRSADLALYDAKRAQRGTGRIFGTDLCVLPDWSQSDLAGAEPEERWAVAGRAH